MTVTQPESIRVVVSPLAGSFIYFWHRDGFYIILHYIIVSKHGQAKKTCLQPDVALILKNMVPLIDKQDCTVFTQVILSLPCKSVKACHAGLAVKLFSFFKDS